MSVIAESLHTTPKVTVMDYGQRLTVEITYGWQHFSGNAHPHFTIMGSGWYPGDPLDDPTVGGQMVDENVLKVMPWLRPIKDLHLHNAITGEPMYAVANGWYWFVGDTDNFPPGWRTMASHERAAAYLKVDPAYLVNVQTKDDLIEVIETQLKPLWKKLAIEAIQYYKLADPNHNHS